MKTHSAFINSSEAKSKSYVDNSNRITRIFRRLNSYFQIFSDATKKGIKETDLLKSQFPFWFKDSDQPPIVAIELTNYCNLKCPYCTSPLGQRERGYMNEVTFSKIVGELKKLRPLRIQLVGNGESTIHPEFQNYLKQLTSTGHYVSLVTNGQWINPKVNEILIESKIDLIEFSIDAGGKEAYEKSRINGKYETLINNLTQLKNYRNFKKAKTVINIRLMLRPSQKSNYKIESEYWKQLGDKVMPQDLIKINNTNYEEDLFYPIQTKLNSYPKCSMPFKHMEFKFSGEVLMCYYTLHQIGPPGLVLGNVNDSTILQLWNHPIMKTYRDAHRNRNSEKMSVCKSCPGT